MRIRGYLIPLWLWVTLLGCFSHSNGPTTSSSTANLTSAEHVDEFLKTVAPPEPATMTTALTKAVRFLSRQQKESGAFCSDLYASFKDGSALTPLVLRALQLAGDVDASCRRQVQQALERGYDFLSRWSNPDGSLRVQESDLEYPVYTAALTLEVLSHPSAQNRAKLRTGWIQYLKERQLTERLGWRATDHHYGGWGYCRIIPYKPKPGQFAPPFTESNLSATRFALQGLTAADALDRQTAGTALVFVRRMQNWGSDIPERLRDGGFHFMPDDPVRNKAGLVVLPAAAVAGPPQAAFASYGSMTADGYLALLLCRRGGAFDPSQDIDRLQAAAQWLQQHFQVDQHPGAYIPAHESHRNAVYYYYAAAVAYAWTEAERDHSSSHPWAPPLAHAVLKRQQPEGFWENPCELVRENEPLVATAQAVIALALCHKKLHPRSTLR
jgi:hypothetical protein